MTTDIEKTDEIISVLKIVITALVCPFLVPLITDGSNSETNVTEVNYGRVY